MWHLHRDSWGGEEEDGGRRGSMDVGIGSRACLCVCVEEERGILVAILFAYIWRRRKRRI